MKCDRQKMERNDNGTDRRKSASYLTIFSKTKSKETMEQARCTAVSDLASVLRTLLLCFDKADRPSPFLTSFFRICTTLSVQKTSVGGVGGVCVYTHFAGVWYLQTASIDWNTIRRKNKTRKWMG